jgi:hypothetical protein
MNGHVFEVLRGKSPFFILSIFNIFRGGKIDERKKWKITKKRFLFF